MELRSRRKTLISSTVDESNDRRKEDGFDSQSDNGTGNSSDDEAFLALSSSPSDDDDSESSDGGYVVQKKARSLKRKNRPKREVEIEEPFEPNDDFEDFEAALELSQIAESSEPKKSRQKGRKKKEPKPVLMWQVWEEENERWLDENAGKDFSLENSKNEMVETAEAPPDITVDLLRYQREWLAWAMKQEDSANRGGILADEMGMGKTLQAIALVLAKRQFFLENPEPELAEASASEGLRKIKGTLVICPVVAVSQWVSEINKFTAKESTNVLVYHGGKREKHSNEFGKYDFVITTYALVEAEFRKYAPPKDKCKYCGKMYYEAKMKLHLLYYCGPEACRTSNQSKQKKKSKSTPLKSKFVSGSNEVVDNEEIYDSVKSKQSGTRQAPKGKSPLFSYKWERIILDEAHNIKSRHSSTARATQSLASSFRWALSGTPIQNRVAELYSLVRFLQVVPYSFYFCKDCDCRVLDRSASVQDCPNCPHKSVRHMCWWNKFITSPIQHHSSSDYGKRAMILLQHKVLPTLVLRRTKVGRAADLALPPRIITLRKDRLDRKEQDYYKFLYHDSEAEFNTFVEAGTLMNNFAHIFELLTRLRQAVDHPYLVEYSASAALRKENKANVEIGEQLCGICNDPAEDHVVTSCEHVFCKACLLDYSSSLGKVACPSCSKLLTVDFTSKLEASTSKTTIKGFKSSSILNRIELNNFQTSTKIEALREEIRYMVERDGSAKGIVFSQFTSFLDLIHYSLLKSGVKCVQLVGSMNMKNRDDAIKKFVEDPDCKIFLMSLKAGGVALNLTVASHVFLMDPWWNPAVERQAQDRIHRIGQYKPIRIVRFVIENTIEERILKLQERKELVFEGTVGGSQEALGKLSERDLRFLFSL